MVALQKKQSLLFIRCWLIQALKNKHICLKVSFFLITFLSWSSCPFLNNDHSTVCLWPTLCLSIAGSLALFYFPQNVPLSNCLCLLLPTLSACPPVSVRLDLLAGLVWTGSEDSRDGVSVADGTQVLLTGWLRDRENMVDDIVIHSDITTHLIIYSHL